MSIILNEYQRAIRRIQLAIGRVRPGGKEVHPVPKMVKWDEVPEDQRQLFRWSLQTRENGPRYALVPPSAEELEEMRLNKIWYHTTMYEHLFKENPEFAYRYAKNHEQEFKEYHIPVKTWDFPACYLAHDGQCTMQCPFFDGKCTYEGDKNENSL